MKDWKSVSDSMPVNTRTRNGSPRYGTVSHSPCTGCRGNREDFIRLLNRQGIDVVFRENNEGRIYGATFIDHKNREVYNGSRLGKEFSANAFERLFNGPNNIPDLDAPTPEISRQSSFSADMENAIGQAFGIFDFEANGPDPQEEALARRLQRKKKKKRRSRGIS